MQRRSNCLLYSRPDHTVLILISTLASVCANHFHVERVESSYGIPGGYLSVKLPSSLTAVDRNHLQPCRLYARTLEEPYTHRYMRRKDLADVNSQVPFSYWNWEGNFTKADYDSAAKWATKYKIIDGKVYVSNEVVDVDPNHSRKKALEDLLKATVYLYPIPDMEFLLAYGDACFPGRPIITQALCRTPTNSGFSIPSFEVWLWSLGPTQMAAFHGCLWDRYPADRRKPMVVWRGSTTGACRFPRDLNNCMKLFRAQLHMLGRNHSDVLDARIYHFVQECGEVLKGVINDSAPFMEAEEFNQYCAVIDVDGNSWSDRFLTRLVHYPTPVLKAATNYTAFAEHFYPPGIAIEQFDTMESLLEKVKSIVADCKAQGDKSYGQMLARRAQETSRLMLDHVAVIRATAYALTNYRKFSAWEPDLSTENFTLLDAKCCSKVSLPSEMLVDLNRRM